LKRQLKIKPKTNLQVRTFVLISEKDLSANIKVEHFDYLSAISQLSYDICAKY